jgi:large subunit ribosomal protein L32
MGPLPKRRKTHSRAAQRLSHTARKPSALVSCPQCHSPILPHHVCPVCGYYNGREVVKKEEKKKKEAA